MSKRPPILLGSIAGLLVTAPLLAVMYAATQLIDLPFVPFDFFDWITRIMPGPLVTFGIDAMINVLTALGISVADTAKTAEHLMAIGIILLLGVLIGAAFFAVLNRLPARSTLMVGLGLGALVGVAAAVLSASIGQWKANVVLQLIWVVGLLSAWGAALHWLYNRLAGVPKSDTAAFAAARGEELTFKQVNRRQFLIRMGTTAAAITVVGTGLGAAIAAANKRREMVALSVPLETHTAESIDPAAPLPNANDPVVPAPGTRPELTPVEEHYKVFIRTLPSRVDIEGWRLPITGLVDNPLELSLDDLRSNYEPIHRYVTLSCISNRVGGDLIGTTLWTGASFKQVLADAGVQPDAQFVVIESEDGFYETVSLDMINADERIMLTYDWNGAPLPYDHGAPLRIYIPDRFGMKQPKWITSMRVVAAYEPGYWVERGWSEIAQMRATSVIDTVAVQDKYEQDGQVYVPIGGIAHAGDRGISEVEVRIDGGDWTPAELRAPISDTTWVIWRYDLPFQAGEHTFEVRCFEGSGAQQLVEINPPRPDGATGLHAVEATL